MSLNIEQTPVMVMEYLCSSCGQWFAAKKGYSMLGCPFCGEELAYPNGEVEILTVKPVPDDILTS